MAHSAPELLGTPGGLFHWIPGELVVVVRLYRHPAEETLKALMEQVRTQLNALLAPTHIVLEPYGTQGRWLDNASLLPLRQHAFLFGRHRQQPLVAFFYHARYTIPQTGEDAMPMAVSYILMHLEQLSRAGLHLVSVMPNWLVTAAPLLYGGGGPAMPPVQTTNSAAAGNRPTRWHISFLESWVQFDPRQAGDVTVAVLDTAYAPGKLLNVARHPAYLSNGLLQQLVEDLRSGSGAFEIDFDRYPVIGDVCSGQGANGEPAFYFMPDHGLFVVGLIRDIAPKAHIRLMRILNDLGGGDLYNLFGALTYLEQEVASGTIRKLVINLSLNVMPDIRRLPYIWFDDRQWPSRQLAGAIRVLTYLEEGLRLLFESLHAQGILVVAAAGNDSLSATSQGKQPNPPRAPARYETVLGVSAVNSRSTPSAFSNAACMLPGSTGVATFGGDSSRSAYAYETRDAVRGLYLSPSYPTGEPNVSGWADWSGTSFATAIISGLGAHLLAQGWSATNAINRIASGRERRTDKLFGFRLDAPDLLANVVQVEQRFG